jgi:hypothetical protein
MQYQSEVQPRNTEELYDLRHAANSIIVPYAENGLLDLAINDLLHAVVWPLVSLHSDWAVEFYLNGSSGYGYWLQCEAFSDEVKFTPLAQLACLSGDLCIRKTYQALGTLLGVDSETLEEAVEPWWTGLETKKLGFKGLKALIEEAE